MGKGRARDERKEAFWRRVVGRQGESGETVRGFCRKKGLRESAFYFWRRELARREAAPPAFLPVQVTEEAAAGGRIEIVLSGGRQVHVAGPVDREALAAVLAVLEGRPPFAQAREGGPC
jgi:transposase-like protein